MNQYGWVILVAVVVIAWADLKIAIVFPEVNREAFAGTSIAVIFGVAVFVWAGINLWTEGS